MSHKSQKAEEPAEIEKHEHEDDLIVVPKGQNRLRYLMTIALVLFLLVIFVVADTFQSALTGGGGRPDAVYITWQDPVDGTTNEVMESEFFETSRLLSIMTSFGVYVPDSYMFGDQDFNTRRRPEPSEEDVASFLIFEDMAEDAGIAVSQKEHVDLLVGRFRDAQGLNTAAAQARMPPKQLEDSIRRVTRVNKLRLLLLGATGIPDTKAVVDRWREDNPEYQFQIVSALRSEYVDQAMAEVPEDDALTTWFHERPQFEQEKLYTEARVVPEVAYVPLAADAAFDAAALLAAYPAPEGIDVDEQARNYHRQFRSTRFRVPPEEQKQPQKDEESEGDDGAEGDGDADGADDEPKADDPPKLFYEFEEVEEQVRKEAPIHAALGAFLTDLQDKANAGEEVDLAAEAERVGLVHQMGPEEGYTRAEIGELEGWGSAMIAGQLIFGAEGLLITRVVVSEGAMTIARVSAKIDRVEPPFADIREQVAEMWAEERASELAVESLENVRQVLAVKPEDVEPADWNPSIEKEKLQQLAEEAGYAYYVRPWLERSSVPNDDFAKASPADRHVLTQPALFELEPGQVAAPAASVDKESAFLVRYEGKRLKEASEIGAQMLIQMRARQQDEDMRGFAAKVFLGDGPWLVERTGLAFPERDRREAERAKDEPTDGGTDGDESAPTESAG